MIPNEKIEQAAQSIYHSTELGEDINHVTFENIFTAGVRFAEAEMKQTAQEFAEWCEMNGWVFDKREKKWFNVLHIGYKTTAELYAKFEAETADKITP